jgi:FkbM family methyltransferase
MGIKNQVLKIVRSVLNPAGYDILKYKTTYPAHIIRDLLQRNGIGLVLDVGANEGQYSAELRKAGYKGRIISFEPLHDAYQALKASCSADRAWSAEKIALGDRNGTEKIHVSGHSPSSSLLPMTDLHTSSVPGSEYSGDETIELKTLDSIYSELEVAGEKIFMKVDTQGYEMHVLKGAVNSLPLISGLQLELSASALYEGEELYYTICRYVEEKGFRLVRIIPGYTNRATGEMLQFDAVFFRK